MNRWPFRSRSSYAVVAAPATAVHESEPPPASWNLDVGAQIADGRFVLEALGGGSRYEVFLVWDERLMALMVAKVLRPDQTEDDRARRELEREVETLARLAHPVLVRGFGAALEGPYPHLLLEHLEGPTLRRLVKRHGALPLEQLLPLALHIAAALHYLAASGYVHLDVKPSNIVMGVPPRLIDLSIARSVESAGRLKVAIGTDAYMAPEQCAPDAWPGRVGPAADVFGLGATLYHAAVGTPPFPRAKGARASADPAIRFPQLVEGPAAMPGRVPAAVADLIVRMLAREPEARPAARDVASALEPLVATLPTRLALTRRGVRGR